MAKNKKKGQTIKRNEKTSQLLERGEGPTAEEQIDPSVDSPSEISIEGGPGTHGDGGFSTLGGGVYPDEGSEDDAPSYHTWGEAEGAAARRRPDATLGREIHEILTQDPELDATEIQVEVERGAVTLTGVVDSREAKLLAEELVESVTGVREVHNGLMVTPAR